jgi:hypothetical protein
MEWAYTYFEDFSKFRQEAAKLDLQFSRIIPDRAGGGGPAKKSGESAFRARQRLIVRWK